MHVWQNAGQDPMPLPRVWGVVQVYEASKAALHLGRHTGQQPLCLSGMRGMLQICWTSKPFCMYAGHQAAACITVGCVGYASRLLACKQSGSACRQARHAAIRRSSMCGFGSRFVGQAKPLCICTGTPGSSPYGCPMCGVWVSSQPLLEAHCKGRRHLKRALQQADADVTNMGLQPGTAPDNGSVPRSKPFLPDLHLLGRGVLEGVEGPMWLFIPCV